MDQIIISSSWELYFQRFDLRSFDDFYSYSESRTIGKNSRRDVREIILEDAGERKVFFMKRFHEPHFKDVWSGLCRFGRFTSQARVEWENAEYLLKNRIDTYKPVCLGERLRMGVERESFIITEELQATCLLDFVKERWSALSRPARERIIVAVANFVRRIQELNVCFPYLYIQHFFIHAESGDGDCRFSIIDLHRMTRNSRAVHEGISRG